MRTTITTALDNRAIARRTRLNSFERLRLLERYRDGVGALCDLVTSLSRADLQAQTGDEWSAHYIIHHIADAELIESVRLRRILAEDNPVLPWIDEAEHARRLHYDRQVETSVGVFGAVVGANLSLVERLAEPAWLRSGQHSVAGTYSVEDWLRKMSEHAHEHLMQLKHTVARSGV